MSALIAAPAPVAAGPVAESDRLHLLDVLRAIALLGIFVVNIEYMARPVDTAGYGIDPALAGVDFALAWIEYVLAHGKFWMLFALLFGAGVAVMRARAEAAGRAFARTYLRRTGVLFLLGVAHATLLWGGDILHTYAVAALVLMALLQAARAGCCCRSRCSRWRCSCSAACRCSAA
jgi:uncharacterized protein